MIDWVKEVSDAKKRLEDKEQRQIRDAEIKEIDVRHDSIMRELEHIDTEMRKLREQRLEAIAKLDDLMDRYGVLMELQHES